VLVAGVCEALGDGRLGNSAVILDRGELVTAYRRTHLWDREKLVFAAGDEPVAHWVAALRRGRRLGTRTVECRGDFLSAARSTPVFADVLLGHRGTGCFGPEEICTLADVEAALRGAGIAVTPRPAPR
jgi:hypothetical protein